MKELNTEKVDGTGKPIVFIHGWKASLENWKEVRENLDLENPVILYDQRCHGKSPCRKFDIESLAEDLETITEKLDSPVLIGHSLGGMTALKYCTVSKNYSSMILLATCASTPRTKYLSPSQLLKSFWKTLKNLFNTGKHPEKGKKVFRHGRTRPGAFFYGLKAMATYDVRKELGKEKAIVVAGKRDMVVPPEQSKETADLLDCKYQEIDSPHQMLKEEPEKVAETIEKFLTE